MNDLHALLTTIEWKVATGFLAGLAVGMFSRLAVKVLIITAYVLIAFELLQGAGVIQSITR